MEKVSISSDNMTSFSTKETSIPVCNRCILKENTGRGGVITKLQNGALMLYQLRIATNSLSPGS